MKNLLKHSYVVVFCVLTLVNTAYSQADLYLDSINVYVNSYSKLSVLFSARHYYSARTF